MQTAIARDVVETDEAAVDDVFGRADVPRERAGDRGIACWIDGPVDGLSLILHDPDVVLVLVWIEGNLLLLAAARVHMGVGVQIPSLCVMMAQADS